MRKLTYSVFALAAGSLFADTFQFTETESTIDTATIYYISGTNGVNEGTVDNIKTNPSSNAFILEDITVNFTKDDLKGLEITGTAKVSSGEYALGAKGNSVLNFKNGATVGMELKNGFATSYGNRNKGALTINVEKGYLGTIITTAAVAQYGTLNLNLHKANVLKTADARYNSTRLFVDADGQINLNMSADQVIDLDIRTNNNNVFNLSLSDGANLFVKSSTGWLSPSLSGKTSYISLVNGEIDGTVLFLESIVKSDGFVDGEITINHAGVEQKIAFFDPTTNSKMGEDKLRFGETTIDSQTYYYATAIPEPAEWAAIFGAAALALAVYRRRK